MLSLKKRNKLFFIKKELLFVSLIDFVLFSSSVDGFANEADVTEIIKEVESISLPYDENLLQVCEDLIVQLLKDQGVESVPGSLDYSTRLSSIQAEGSFLTDGSDDQLILDYVSFYLSEIATLQLLDGSNQIRSKSSSCNVKSAHIFK